MANDQPPLVGDPRDFGSAPALAQQTEASPLFRFKDFAMAAQKVPVRRSIQDVKRRVGEWCAASPDRYMYSWEAKDRRRGGKSLIEGPTIKMAEMIAREWGNCWAGVLPGVEDTPTHWRFNAIFVDFETGFNLTRPFEQRKTQEMGMGDVDRQRDIVFQIAASKATRNVIVNALDEMMLFGIDVIKRGLIDWIQDPKNREKANEFINDVLERREIDVKRVEAVIGRVRKEWGPKEISRVMMGLRSIEDEWAQAHDVYPPLEVGEAGAAAKTKDKGGKDHRHPFEKDDKKKPGEVAGDGTVEGETVRDSAGEVFNPEFHMVDDTGKPVFAKSGRFKRKRGRPTRESVAAMKAAGKEEPKAEGQEEPKQEEAAQTAPAANGEDNGDGSEEELEEFSLGDDDFG